MPVLSGRFSDVCMLSRPRSIRNRSGSCCSRPCSGAGCAGPDAPAGRRPAGRRILLQRDAIWRLRGSRLPQRAPLVVADYRQRLQDRIDELLGERAGELFDEQRLAAEVAIFADKCSIDEELVRLQSHLDQLTATAVLIEPVGKKLDFLVQEINREINTIGSKANDLELINRVVTMKSELEKIREQIQNLE